MLTNQQKNAIDHHLGPALILAVPGAGKTTVLIHRTANLITKYKINPKKILSITFSRASANDMKSRFSNSFEDINGVSFSTIHSFCFNLIRNYARKTQQVFTMVEDSSNEFNKYSILKEIYLKVNNSYINEDAMESLINYIGYVKNMMISPNKLKPRDIPNFEEIYHEYQSIKQQNNFIDFDDMLTMSYDILTSNPDILNYYRSLYDFIQLDEGQDTSLIQIEIIKLLAYPRNNLFIVADDDQSIYGFRGAYPDALLQFKDIYPLAKIFFMEENFRSSENIVLASNNLITNNLQRFKKNIFTSNEKFEPVKLIKLEKIEDQYKYIVDEIAANDNRNYAILYRNNISAIGLVNELSKKNLDFQIKDRNLKFFNHWVLQDIINFLKFSEDTSNINIYEKIYYKKKGYISRKHLDYARKLNPDSSIFTRVKDFPDIKFFYVKVLNELEADFAMINRLPPEEAIKYIKYDLKYLDYLKEFSDKFGHSFSNLSLILKFLELISKDLETKEELFDRLNYLKSKCYNSNSDNIILSTIHSSKGLEYDNVFMIDLVDGDFPSLNSIDEAENNDDFKFIEEERRLFYVAMTRAKYNLTMFAIDMVDSSKVDSSRFIQDIIIKN